MLILNQSEVERALPMGTCIRLMREAFAALARGEAVQPLRHAMPLPGGGVLGPMPGYLPSAAVLGLKVITAFPQNQGTRFDSHQGAVLLFEPEHGALIAILDATAITGIRTAAVSALATDLMALPEANDLAILGSGTQAWTHLEAMLEVRPIRRCRVWSRTRSRAEAFKTRAGTSFRQSIEVCDSAEDAVVGADIICTTTGARDPILKADWLRQGAHLNVVGSSSVKKREVDSATVKRARIVVDRMESALNEAGDLLIPREEGLTHEDSWLELGDLVLGRKVGRTSPQDVTLFKSMGLAIEDLAAGRHVYDVARREGFGVDLELGGRSTIAG
jgi:ornithine cyclodeaminase/alanine dehydrogenase-like protein (mu-crystallin family)